MHKPATDTDTVVAINRVSPTVTGPFSNGPYDGHFVVA
jgi:hypothetical protein